MEVPFPQSLLWQLLIWEHIPDDPNMTLAKSQVLTFNTNNEHVEGIILYVPS